MKPDTPAWLRRPVLLSPDNFTPLARTPWGGQVIASTYKQSVVKAADDTVIGESWEFSCDPAFPSRILATGETLLEAVQKWPEAILSPRLAASGATCEILLKLLDAAEPLSLQVHPADHDSHLKAGECGKPESWLVLRAAPGAGIYLGFARSMTREALRAALLDGASARDLLHFVAVKPGDYFEIEPGVPHAIGGGVTLLEPQRILTGQAGKTYRLWDWGRRYDAQGRLDMTNGQARPLHVDESLPLVDPERQVGEAFVATLRRQPTEHRFSGGVSVREFPANPYYKTVLCSLPAGAQLTLVIEDGYGALLTLSGAVVVNGETILQGQPALLPNFAAPFKMIATETTELAIVTPALAELSFRT